MNFKALAVILYLASAADAKSIRKLGHHSSKSDKVEVSSSAVGKSDKYISNSVTSSVVESGSSSSSEVIVDVSASIYGGKSDKDVIVITSSYSDDSTSYGKSGKSSGGMSLSMSMMQDDDAADVLFLTGKSEKGGGEYIYSASSWGGKSVKEVGISMSISNQVYGVAKAEKPLTNYFIKTSSYEDDMAAKAGKATEIETVHIETTTVTYENAQDIEIFKPKSGKAEYSGTSSEGTPVVIDYIGAGKSDKYYSSGSSTSNTNSGSSKASKPSSSGTSSLSSSKAAKSPTGSPVLDSSGVPTFVSDTETSSTDLTTPFSSGSTDLTTPASSGSTDLTTPTSSGSTDLTTPGTDLTTPPPPGSTDLTTPPPPGTDLTTPGSSGSTDTAATVVSSGPPIAPGLKDDTLFTLAPSASASGLKRSGESPTYEPTSMPTSLEDPASFELRKGGETFIAMNPFALSLTANSANLDIEKVRVVTMEHLVHSFRNTLPKSYILNRLNLMLLDPEGERRLRGLQSYDEYELFFGGIVYFENDSTPLIDEITSIVKASFTGSRLEYYVNLLKEADMDVASVSFDEHVVESLNGDSSGQKWRVVSVGLASAVGGLALIATGLHVFHKKRRMSNGLNSLERSRYVIKLKDEMDVEEFPGLNSTSTVANTEHDMSTVDDRSIPSLASRSLDAIEQETFDPRISPLEEPPIRYVSVFTVKKDMKGKSLEEIDLRALAIAYLSKMLKKFPNSFLLPYDKESTLPPITSIRNIPDDFEELGHYVGNARVDEHSGKVLFNLRVESDMPVSKMKATKKNHGVSSTDEAETSASKENKGEVEGSCKGSHEFESTTGKEEIEDSSEETKGFEDVTI